jgi:hypothetical protein
MSNNPPNLERLLRQAQTAIAAGRDSAAVALKFRQMSGGLTMEQARERVISRDVAPPPPTPPADDTTVKRGLLATTRDVGRMALQGATAGWGDEIAGAVAAAVPGGRGYREARDESRENIARIRQERPATALAAEVGGGIASAAVGGLAARGAGLAAKGGAAVTRGLLARAGRAAVPAAAGGAYGAGEAEEVPNIPASAAKGAALGAATGAAVPAIGAASRRLRDALRRPQTGESAGAAIRSATGTQRSFTAATEAADELKTAARATFQQLEKKHTAIDNAALREALSSGDLARHARAIAPDVADGTRAPSFVELQAIRDRLGGLSESASRRGRRDVVASLRRQKSQLDDVIAEAVPDFKDANRAFRTAIEVAEGLKDGRRLFSKSAADVTAAMKAASPEKAAALREGFSEALLRRVESSNSAKYLRTLADAGPEVRNKLAAAFSEEAADDIIAMAVRSDRAGVIKLIGQYKGRLAVSGVGAAGFAGKRMLFDD